MRRVIGYEDVGKALLVETGSEPQLILFRYWWSRFLSRIKRCICMLLSQKSFWWDGPLRQRTKLIVNTMIMANKHHIDLIIGRGLAYVCSWTVHYIHDAAERTPYISGTRFTIDRHAALQVQHAVRQASLRCSFHFWKHWAHEPFRCLKHPRNMSDISTVHTCSDPGLSFPCFEVRKRPLIVIRDHIPFSVQPWRSVAI
jgi:hypothetical protein